MVTMNPVLAVLGVLLGATTSVFTGRLLSVGSADVQGALGLSSDSLSWILTSYNAANMFIGPLTVFLGRSFGARKILLTAGVIYMLAEFASPLVGHNEIALVCMQIIAGLSAGTFYPLTLTMIINNFPMKYLYLGVGVYALDIVASTHFAHFVEAYYLTNLDWRWVFWNALIATPFMLVCIYFGVPKAEAKKPERSMTFWGFLYAGCAFTLIYLALDQGERLDWFNSPRVVAFAGAGLVLLSATVVSRIRRPNPLLNLRFLLSRNFLLLGAILIAFRFVILASTLLVPSYLAVLHGYRPEQTSAVLVWISLPVIFFALFSSLCSYKIDSRILCALGFAAVACSCAYTSHLDPGWTGETFFATQLVLAGGLAFALTGLISCILRSALAAGALSVPANILTIGCWFQICRLFGAECGQTFLNHFLRVNRDYHYSILASHINGDWLTDERLAKLNAAFQSDAHPLDNAAATLMGDLKQQLTMLSIGDGFTLIALVCVLAIILVGCVSYSPPLPTGD